MSYHDTLIATRPVEPPAPSPVREYHTFEEVSFRIVLLYRAEVIKTGSTYTAQGGDSAQSEAQGIAAHFHLQPGDPLEVLVTRNVHHYDRLYIGEGPNPLAYRRQFNDSSQPATVAIYDDSNYIQSRTRKHVSSTVHWSTDPARTELTPELLAIPAVIGD